MAFDLAAACATTGRCSHTEPQAFIRMPSGVVCSGLFRPKRFSFHAVHPRTPQPTLSLSALVASQVSSGCAKRDSCRCYSRTIPHLLAIAPPCAATRRPECSSPASPALGWRQTNRRCLSAARQLSRSNRMPVSFVAHGQDCVSSMPDDSRSAWRVKNQIAVHVLLHSYRGEVMSMQNVGAGRSCFARPKRPTPCHPHNRTRTVDWAVVPAV